MGKIKADQTVSIRLPEGMADELRAATGQPVSRLVRWMLTALLEKKRLERAHAISDGQIEVREVVADLPDQPPETLQ